MAQETGVTATRSLADILAEIGAQDLTSDLFRLLRRAAYETLSRRYELDRIRKAWKTGPDGVSKENTSVLAGYCHFLAGDLDRAEEWFSKDRKSPWAAFYLVRIALARQQYEAALKAVENACKKFPEFAPLSFLSIEVYCRNGWEDQVPEILERLERTFADTAEVAFYRGLYHEQLTEFREAAELYRLAIERDPEYAEAHFRLGFCTDLYGRGDDESIDDAIAAYEACLKIVPPHTNAVINLGTLYEDRERYHDAIKCYETVLRYSPNHERARLFLEDAKAATRMFYDREEEKKADRQSQVLKIPVTDFELSVRSRNCLQKMNINVLGDLIMKSEQELLSYKNFGETSLKEIKEMLDSKGLRLGQGLEQKGLDTNQPRNPLEATTDPTTLDRSIDELNLSVRSRRCMERLGVQDLRDLINMTEVQLMSAKNFGMTSLNEIKRKLAEHNLRLRG